MLHYKIFFTVFQEGSNWTAVVTIDSPSIHMYSAHLEFVASLSTIQSLLYRWPIMFFCFGVSCVFIPAFTTMAVFSYFIVWKLALDDGKRLEFISFFDDDKIESEEHGL